MVPIPFVIPRHVAYTNPLENGGFNFTVIFDGVRESAGPQGSTSSWSSDREIDVRLSLSFRVPCGLVPVQVMHSPLLGSRFSLTSGARSCISFHAQACLRLKFICLSPRPISGRVKECQRPILCQERFK